MPAASRRSGPSKTVTALCFIVKDRGGHALAFVYLRRRSRQAIKQGAANANDLDALKTARAEIIATMTHIEQAIKYVGKKNGRQVSPPARSRSD
jgi:hypothetical protein